MKPDTLTAHVENPWLPITQAPKDGSSFLANDIYGCYVVCYYESCYDSFVELGKRTLYYVPREFYKEFRNFMRIPPAPGGER